MEASNSVDVKRLHAKKIWEYFRKNGEGTKRKVSAETDLSFATVSNICNAFREKGYLMETQLSGEKTLGRIPTPLTLNAERIVTVCFDLTKKGVIVAAVLDAWNKFLYETCESYDAAGQIHHVIDCCTEIYQQAILPRFCEENIVGVGIAVPGIFETDTHNIVSSEIPLFNNQPMRDLFREKLHKPVYIDNESNLCAAAMRQPDREKQLLHDIIYVFADAGLGVGVVTGGALVTGSKGYAPEICHIPIGNPNLKCRLCGNYGCVESDLQMEGYIRKYNLNGDSRVEDLAAFSDALEKGDGIAKKVLEENVRIMGSLLSILNNMFNPSVIYIGGETSKFFPKYSEALYHAVEMRAIAKERTMPQILVDADCGKTVLRGAAEMVLTRWVPET